MTSIGRSCGSSVLPEAGALNWQKTYAAKSKDELLEAYKEWTPKYDADTVGKFGYTAPFATAEVVARHATNRNSLWLDAGAGTGQVGEHLAGFGFSNIIAADISDAMLEEAAKKNVYQSIRNADLNDPDSFEKGSLDGIVCVGTFTPSHLADGSILENWISWLKPNGLIVLSLRDDFWDTEIPGKPNVQEASKNLPWTLIETTKSQPYLPLIDDRIMFRVRVWKI